MTEGFRSEIDATRLHTAGYGADPEFRKRWLGFSREARDLRAQQLRAFGALVGSVTATLSGWNILDLGCGDGKWLRTFLEYDAEPRRLVGIDVSDVRFDIARLKNPLINLVKTPGSTIPFVNDHFELVTQFVCFSNIPTIRLRKHVAEEICRVIKPGGFLFWWDLFLTTAPSDDQVPLRPSDYFDWPIRELKYAELPRPSECFRFPSLRRLSSPLLDWLGYPIKCSAALIGPKPIPRVEA